MTNDEALALATRVATAYPKPEWNADRIALFAEAIVALPHDLTLDAVRLWHRTQRWQPTPSDLAELVNQAIARRALKSITDERRSGSPIDRDTGIKLLREIRRKLERNSGLRVQGPESLGAVIGEKA